jgi:hypothetical protein
MARLTTASGKTTVIFEYSASNAIMTSILVNAARRSWQEKNPLLDISQFEALTNAQKLELLNVRIKDYIIGLAKTEQMQSALEEARKRAAAEADTSIKFDEQ